MKRILFTATVAVAGALAAATTFHVDAQGGDDSGPGSQERPFATLERARDAVRALKSSAERFPQGDPAERERVLFASNPELERLARENPLAVQDSPLFKAVKPNFPRIPVEGIGLRGAAR